MKRPLADKRPIGPFAQMSSVRNELIEFELHPAGTEFNRITPAELENELQTKGLRADIVEDPSGVYIVKVRTSIRLFELEHFIDVVNDRMDIDKDKSTLVP
jgi:hypothetical protein